MMQPETTSGAEAKPNSSAPEQRPDDHVAAGLELPVDLDDDPVPQPVGQQRLLGLGQADLPGDAGVLERGERRRAGAAVVARDEHHVGVGLGHPGRHRAHADLGHQLHVHPGGRVGRLEVVDELGDVLNGVDVVVRRRRDQLDPRRRVCACGRSTGQIFLPGELAALPRLGALRDLDLQVVRVDQVLAGHAEAARGHLLDGAPPQVAVGVGGEAVGVLAALAGVRAPADPVHGDGQVLVRLGRDGAVGHGAGGEAGHDGLDRLDLLDGDGAVAAGERAGPAGSVAAGRWTINLYVQLRVETIKFRLRVRSPASAVPRCAGLGRAGPAVAAGAQPQEAAQGGQLLGLVVDQRPCTP